MLADHLFVYEPGTLGYRLCELTIIVDKLPRIRCWRLRRKLQRQLDELKMKFGARLFAPIDFDIVYDTETQSFIARRRPDQ